MSFFSKIFGSKPETLTDLTDYHSHILPGVDDGVQEMEHSLQILAEYERIGFSTVWLTPHIMEDIPNTTAALRERFDELCNAYRGPIRLRLAAENMLDTLFEERLETGDLLYMQHNGDPTKYLLVETSCVEPPYDFLGTLHRIMAAGYRPIIAHPERYAYMPDLRMLQQMVDMGAQLQLNVMSLVGIYGKAAQKRAHEILKHGTSRGGMYSYYGSDIHRRRMIQPLSDALSSHTFINWQRANDK